MSDDNALDLNDSAKSPRELEDSPKSTVARWMAEWELASATEKSWRNDANDIYKLYEGDKEKAFNILWSNTETVVPAVFNSAPVPDVRRRFRDPDPVGKWASRIIERALVYVIDIYPYTERNESVVLDSELLGRGVGRIKYQPQFAKMDQAKPSLWKRLLSMFKPKTPEEAPPEPDDVVIDESTELDHVQWDKFRHGPGKTWDEVTWVGFEHEFTKEMAEESFGEDVAELLKYNAPAHEDAIEKSSSDIKSLFRVAIVREIWDKTDKRVLFVAECYKDAPLNGDKGVEDPLKVNGFFPMPAPIYSIKNTRTLIPQIRYKMYERQAQTLENISKRIDKIVSALRLRGAYSSGLPELADMLDPNSADGDMVAVANVSAVMEGGGLDKMIWIMPIDRLKAVLEALIVARNECKQAIYEIVGLSDIMRGATDPNETLGAQEIKTQWGGVRLEKFKRRVEDFCRATLRLKADIICQHFSMDTLQQITQIQLPTKEQKDQAAMAARDMAIQAQMQGQPPPPPDPELQGLLEMPTWEDVMQVLKSDFMRSTRIDIETDSTVAETINRDMTGINEALTTIGAVGQQALPLVQSGMLPLEAVKQLMMGVARRARFGQVVEDALEDMQQPAPEAQPGGEGQDGAAQKAVMTAENKAQKAEAALQAEKIGRSLDKQKHELDLRDLELKVREDALQQQQQQVQQEAQAVQQQGQQLQQQIAAREAELTTIGGAPQPGAIQ